jgi:hypothetical protein
MAKIFDLNAYRIKAVEQRGFGPWRARFAESYDSKTRLADISDKTLHYLAQPGEASSIAYYELVMGILDLGAALKFHYLSNKQQLIVVDLHLFLADQVRFELMRRLGWIQNFAGEAYTLLEMVQNFDHVINECRRKPPQMAASNPAVITYTTLTNGDKEVFLRRMLQEAIETFKKRL